jgi:hypothetical protein
MRLPDMDFDLAMRAAALLTSRRRYVDRRHFCPGATVSCARGRV